jgi:hypothetical protein
MGGLMSQRRKFEIAINMTGPVFGRLPPVIREMVHEIIHCRDQHTMNHMFKRGERCIYYKEDVRGMLSMPGRHRTRKKVFHTKPWWPYYDTYQATDFQNQFINVRFKKKIITISSDGKVINPTQSVNTDDKFEWISNIISDIKDKKMKNIEPWQLNSMLGRPITATIKGWLRVHGIHWDPDTQGYIVE